MPGGASPLRSSARLVHGGCDVRVLAMDGARADFGGPSATDGHAHRTCSRVLAADMEQAEGGQTRPARVCGRGWVALGERMITVASQHQVCVWVVVCVCV